jgi:hypothetical protein
MSKAIYSQFDQVQSAYDHASCSTTGPTQFDPNWPDIVKCKRCKKELKGFPKEAGIVGYDGAINTDALRDHLITEHLLEPINGTGLKKLDDNNPQEADKINSNGSYNYSSTA